MHTSIDVHVKMHIRIYILAHVDNYTQTTISITTIKNKNKIVNCSMFVIL